ncbi:MAG: hypothetical protein WCO56_02030 [Verrucomicrobiota bacterium]
MKQRGWIFFSSALIWALLALSACKKPANSENPPPIKSASAQTKPAVATLPGTKASKSNTAKSESKVSDGPDDWTWKQYNTVIAGLNRHPDVMPSYFELAQEMATVIGKQVPALADHAAMRKALAMDQFRSLTNALIRDKDAEFTRLTNSMKYAILRNPGAESRERGFTEATTWVVAISPELHASAEQYQSIVTRVLTTSRSNLVEVRQLDLKRQAAFAQAMVKFHQQTNLFTQLQQRLQTTVLTKSPTAGAGAETKLSPQAEDAKNQLFKINGVMIAGERSRVFLNGVLILKNESAEVIAAGQKCIVKCLDIAQDQVTIQVNNQPPMILKVNR